MDLLQSSTDKAERPSLFALALLDVSRSSSDAYQHALGDSLAVPADSPALSGVSPEVSGASRDVHDVLLDLPDLSSDVPGLSPEVPDLFQDVAVGVPATPCASSDLPGG